MSIERDMNENREYPSVDIDVEVGGRIITARILSPVDGQLAADPLLMLHFTGEKESALYEAPYSHTTTQFLEAGHRVLSFDLPSHGTRIDHFGESLTGFCNAFVSGQDPFLLFIEEAIAVIDRCITEGLASAERIVACGTSRAAYLAVRLMAAEPRIAAVAAIAPVTDWRALSEFASAVERPDVAALHLSEFVNELVGRPIYIVIGNHDARVSTPSCCQFYIDLVNAHTHRGYDDSLIRFEVLDVPGHFSPAAWHRAGGVFLLDARLPITSTEA
jgi:pimeloyl-ACP methyl ester carboxylesterase